MNELKKMQEKDLWKVINTKIKMLDKKILELRT